MVGVNVPIPVPVAFYSFGGWKSSLFGDLHVHGVEGVKFYTRTKVGHDPLAAPGHAGARPEHADARLNRPRRERTMNTNRRLAAIAAAALVAGCAPDEFRPSPGYDGFLDLIAQVCYPDTIGPTLVKQWAQGYGPGGGGAGFMDATSKLYYGKMDPPLIASSSPPSPTTVRRRTRRSTAS